MLLWEISSPFSAFTNTHTRSSMLFFLPWLINGIVSWGIPLCALTHTYTTLNLPANNLVLSWNKDADSGFMYDAIYYEGSLRIVDS